ncbi:hypothetical protein AMJ87_13355 [candidate division WOR_3 bacterium SM23_60]|uniref:AsmA-like C-terminal domain-containing protein n=1 Tax=candidate division WOR_3 bacterium SM23_60 TaxID=1703780 RepID=A0A0S8G5M2_UNCW3|nr:MAG: hypothetical protein AMJ87_13355 [candidate division WOR_3 bacterium SM23_60]
MNKIAKIILIVALVIVVGIVGAYVAISSYLTPERVQGIANRVASEGLQREVTIGTVGIRIGLTTGITINDVIVANTEGFGPEPLLTVDQATLVLRLLPLIQRKIVIGRVDLDGTHARIVHNEKGKTNFELTPSQAQTGHAWALAVSSVKLTHSTVEYTDRKNNIKMRLEDITQTISISKDALAFAGDGVLHSAASKDVPEITVQMSNHLTYELDKKKVTIERFTVEYERARIDAAGTITNLKDVDIAVKGDIGNIAALTALIPATSRPEKISGAAFLDGTVGGTIEKLSYEGLCELKDVAITPKGLKRGFEKINGKLRLEQTNVRDIAVHGRIGNAEVKVSGSVDNVTNPVLNLTAQVQGDLSDFENLAKGMEGMKMKGPLTVRLGVRGTSAAPVYSGTYAIENATVDGIGLAQPITGFALKGTFAQSGADIQQCTGVIGNTDFSLSGRITDFKKPTVELTNRSNQVNLDEFLTEQVRADKGLPITLQGTMAIKKLMGMGMEFANINTKFMYRDFVVDIKNCAAEAFDGSVLLDFHYDARNPEPYRLNAKLTSVSARPVLKRLFKISSIEGRLSSDGIYEGRSFRQADVKANLNAKGTYVVTNGAFNNFTFTTQLLKWLGLKDYSTMDIREMAGHFVIQNGKAKVEDWVLTSSYGNFLVNGTIGLSGNANLDIVTTLDKKYSGIIKQYHAEWLLPFDGQGRATIDIKASGTLQSPSFSLNKTKIQERLKGKITDDFKKKQQELQNKIKGLFGG